MSSLAASVPGPRLGGAADGWLGDPVVDDPAPRWWSLIQSDTAR